MPDGQKLIPSSFLSPSELLETASAVHTHTSCALVGPSHHSCGPSMDSQSRLLKKEKLNSKFLKKASVPKVWA